MPIFEENEDINNKEFARQQKALTEKIFRLQWKNLVEQIDKDLDDFVELNKQGKT